MCGVGMLIFQLFVYPFVLKRMGPKQSQRWICCMMIPVCLSYPLLSTLHDDGKVLLTASLVLL
ncbi:unnamed protein product, partial [Laminaria digitata]